MGCRGHSLLWQVSPWGSDDSITNLLRVLRLATSMVKTNSYGRFVGRINMRLICLLLALGLTGVTRGQESSTESAKIGRILHTMVWTGKEIIVWGGGSEGQFY